MAINFSHLSQKLKKFSFFDSFKHASVYFSGTVLVQGLGIISMPVLTYFLSEQEYGITSVYISYTLIASILLSCNLEWAISRYFLEPEADKKGFISTIFVGVTMFFVISSVFIYYFRVPISACINLPEESIFWLLLYTYTNIIWFIYVNICIVEKKSKEITLSMVLVQYGKFGLAVLGIWYFQSLNKEGYLAKIIAEFLVNALAMFVFLYLIWPYFDRKSISWKHLRYAMYYSIPLVPYALGGQILSSFDQWYINSELGHEQAGYYSFAYKIGLLMNGLLIALHNASVVHYTKMMDEKDDAAISSQVYSIHKMTLLAGFFLILFSVDIGTLLAAKASFRNSLTIVPIIVGGYIFYGIAMLYSRVFNYNKTNIYLTVILLSAGVLNVFLNMAYIPTYGYKAAAYTTLISYIFMALVSWITSTFWLKMPELPLLKILGSLMPMVILTLFFYQLGWDSVGMNAGIITIKILAFALFGILLFYNTIQRIIFKS